MLRETEGRTPYSNIRIKFTGMRASRNKTLDWHVDVVRGEEGEEPRRRIRRRRRRRKKIRWNRCRQRNIAFLCRSNYSRDEVSFFCRLYTLETFCRGKKARERGGGGGGGRKKRDHFSTTIENSRQRIVSRTPRLLFPSSISLSLYLLLHVLRISVCPPTFLHLRHTTRLFSKELHFSGFKTWQFVSLRVSIWIHDVSFTWWQFLISRELLVVCNWGGREGEKEVSCGGNNFARSFISREIIAIELKFACLSSIKLANLFLN